ncbi:MAG: patatin-like phospholipase family protein [Ignavibacteriaceae bacterium]|nr:patatin-like phospholipase family protein [Ignavibacteriaceae bacterium]
MDKKKIFRILSLDGGGFKGLYTAKVLSEIEKRFGKIYENFNLICGTSTGGIIALGLGLGKCAEEIVDYYLQYGPKIFPSDTFFKRSYHIARQFTFAPKYSDSTLRKSLNIFFKDALMKDAKCNLCIPAINLSDAQGIVFKTPHFSEFVRDANLKMVDVALATSAAPTFFPSATIPSISSGLVDGGLWANNPSFVGAIEAVSYFVGNDKLFEEFSILSIGTLSSSKSWYPSKHKKGSIIRWGTKIFPLTISAQSNAMNNLLKIASDKKLFPMGNYIRIDEPAVSPNQMKHIDLDKASSKSIRILLDLANSTVNTQLSRKEITELFNK